jgi:hypothetical protein
MKKLLRILAIALCAITGTTFADDFKSITIPGDGAATTETALTRVHGDQFLFVRNFTQEDGTTRGVVIVSQPNSNTGMPVNVLAAALLDQSMPTEVINTVVIAGPADVSVTCGASPGKNCFISFKKEGGN